MTMFRMQTELYDNTNLRNLTSQYKDKLSDTSQTYLHVNAGTGFIATLQELLIEG